MDDLILRNKVVKKYINDHPNVTYFELENVFSSRLNANTKNGVVRRWSDIRQKITGHPDVATRFFCEPHERITLADGTVIVIHNQWGKTNGFDRFLAVARKLYDVKCNENNENQLSLDF